MIEIASLTIYPLKGGRGVSLPEVAIDRLGPRNDRRWMVVDLEGNHLTQREVARLCQVSAKPVESGLSLNAPYAPPLEVSRPPDEQPRRSVQVWADRVDALDAGDAAAEWLSRFLLQPSRLVYFPDSTYRPTDPDYDTVGSPVSFADGFPILLVSEASLADLNRRLATPLPMNRFRPNIVVRGVEPFAEDGWRRFQVGSIEFDAVKPCARCVVTTTDQDSGERSPEPLRTLATFRKRGPGSGVMFGVNVVHRGTGLVRVGDRVVLPAAEPAPDRQSA
jgi:uncharacterized protein YcbX